MFRHTHDEGSLVFLICELTECVSSSIEKLRHALFLPSLVEKVHLIRSLHVGHVVNLAPQLAQCVIHIEPFFVLGYCQGTHYTISSLFPRRMWVALDEVHTRTFILATRFLCQQSLVYTLPQQLQVTLPVRCLSHLYLSFELRLLYQIVIFLILACLQSLHLS